MTRKSNDDKRLIDANEVMEFMYSEMSGKEEQIQEWIEECGLSDLELFVSAKEGEGRYVVHFKFADSEKEGKFFTNSEELKQLLDKVSEIDDGFPFRTTIKRTTFNGKSKYSFT